MISISRLLSQIARDDPQRPAVTHEGQTITRQELDRQSNQLAREYAGLGVQQGDMVTVVLPNSIEFYTACFAIWKLGAIPAPASARLPRDELQGLIDLAGPTLVVGASGEQVQASCPVLPPGHQVDPQLDDGPLPDRISPNWKAPCSGGSTGRPKIIVSGSPGAFDFSGELPIRLERNRSHLVTGPLYHNAPFTFSVNALLLGNHVVVMTRFDARHSLELIEKHRIDWLMMVPTMMRRIWLLPEAERQAFDLSSLRILLHLAAPCPPWLKEAFIEWLGAGVIHELFGGTEATGVSWITGEEWLERRGSVGRLLAGKVRVLDDNGQDLPPGEIGELYMLPDTGQGSTYHYLGAEPRAVEGGWESLGDMGYVDEDGYIYLSDRRTDMILAGGANIYPAEVEAAIEAHPAVRSCAVIGLPDEDLGQAVHGIVDAPAGVTGEELAAFLGDKLVRYKIPRSFEFVGEPLRDDAGKVRRSALLEERKKNLAGG